MPPRNAPVKCAPRPNPAAAPVRQNSVAVGGSQKSVRAAHTTRPTAPPAEQSPCPQSCLLSAPANTPARSAGGSFPAAPAACDKTTATSPPANQSINGAAFLTFVLLFLQSVPPPFQLLLHFLRSRRAGHVPLPHRLLQIKHR